jgi:hypothetical protein
MAVTQNTFILTDQGYIRARHISTQRVWDGYSFVPFTPEPVVKANMITVTLSDGSSVRCSEDHEFTLPYGIRTSDLELGTRLNKPQWPVIEGSHKQNISMYEQGCYSGSVWITENSRPKTWVPHNMSSCDKLDWIRGLLNRDMFISKNHSFLMAAKYLLNTTGRNAFVRPFHERWMLQDYPIDKVPFVRPLTIKKSGTEHNLISTATSCVFDGVYC